MNNFLKYIVISASISSLNANNYQLDTAELMNLYKTYGLDFIKSNANIPSNLTLSDSNNDSLKIETTKTSIEEYNIVGQTTLHIDSNGFINIDISLFKDETDTTPITNTTFNVDDVMNIEISESGALKSNFSIKDINITFEIEAKGSPTIHINDSNGKAVELLTPIDSKNSIDSDGNFISNNLYVASDGNISSTIEYKESGEIIATAIDSNGEVFTLMPPNESETRTVELINAENFLDSFKRDRALSVDSIKSGRFKSTYSVRRKFSLNSYFLRDTSVQSGSDILVIPNSEVIECEQNTYFNGIKTVKLTNGDANISIDGNIEPMLFNEEYVLDWNNSKVLQIQKGWNLISLPTDKDLNTTLFTDYNSIWTYQDDWNKNPYILNPKFGFWIDSNIDSNLTFWGSDYKPDLTNLSKSWNLLGTGQSLSDVKTNWNYQYVWVYRDNIWVENPSIIKAGEGFWIFP